MARPGNWNESSITAVVVCMTATNRTPVRIDVWSDVACPWCYIGKHNLENGIAATTQDDDAPEVEITYHSFELAHDTPIDVGLDSVGFVAKRMGVSRRQAQEMNDRVTRMAKEQAGLEYRLDLQQYTNTAKAHELVHLAKAQGKQLEMTERLMAAHFTEGRHIGHVDELVELAADVGLDAIDTREALEAGTYRSAVLADEEQAGAYGISGVPFFVIDGKYGVNGAQPAETFTNAVRRVWAERNAD
jgi:predicted DsbA family dithiol-disulfide isomerase